MTAELKRCIPIDGRCQPRVKVGKWIGDNMRGRERNTIELLRAMAVPHTRPFQPIRREAAIAGRQIHNCHALTIVEIII